MYCSSIIKSIGTGSKTLVFYPPGFPITSQTLDNIVYKTSINMQINHYLFVHNIFKLIAYIMNIYLTFILYIHTYLRAFLMHRKYTPKHYYLYFFISFISKRNN